MFVTWVSQTTFIISNQVLVRELIFIPLYELYLGQNCNSIITN